jgi:hypothetical protein
MLSERLLQSAAEAVVPATAAGLPQDAVGHDAALEKGVILNRASSDPVLASVGAMKLYRMLLNQAIQLGLLGAMASTVERAAIGRPLGLATDGWHTRLPKW